ncbi:hypothetical protein D3C87_1499790 [compost metagenome]
MRRHGVGGIQLGRCCHQSAIARQRGIDTRDALANVLWRHRGRIKDLLRCLPDGDTLVRDAINHGLEALAHAFKRLRHRGQEYISVQPVQSGRQARKVDDGSPSTQAQRRDLLGQLSARLLRARHGIAYLR